MLNIAAFDICLHCLLIIALNQCHSVDGVHFVVASPVCMFNSSDGRAGQCGHVGVVKLNTKVCQFGFMSAFRYWPFLFLAPTRINFIFNKFSHVAGCVPQQNTGVSKKHQNDQVNSTIRGYSLFSSNC